jgi:hypothetical protein
VQVGIVAHALLPGVVLEVAGEGLEVHPGAEVAARPGDDGDAEVGVLVDLDPGVVHPRHHLHRQGVLALRAVERDDRDVAVALEEEVRFGHGVLQGGKQGANGLTLN